MRHTIAARRRSQSCCSPKKMRFGIRPWYRLPDRCQPAGPQCRPAGLARPIPPPRARRREPRACRSPRGAAKFNCAGSEDLTARRVGGSRRSRARRVCRSPVLSLRQLTCACCPAIDDVTAVATAHHRPSSTALVAPIISARSHRRPASEISFARYPRRHAGATEPRPRIHWAIRARSDCCRCRRRSPLTAVSVDEFRIRKS